MVRFGCTVQLIHNDPQILFIHVGFFEFHTCVCTIQVNFFTFTLYLKIYKHKKL